MMLRNIFIKTLRDQRRSLVWWAVGLVWVIFVYVGGYRQYVKAGFFRSEVPEFVGALMGSVDFASAAGYLQAVVFTLLAPLLVVLFAMFAGARAIAGDEEVGMLDILLAYPVSRRRLVLERSGALAIALAWLGFVVWAAVSVAASINDMGIGLDRIAAAAVGLSLLGLTFGTLALALGAVTGSRGIALGITTGAVLVAFLANNLASQIKALEPVQKISPYYYYLGGDPLRSGFDLPKLAVLALASLVLVGLALWGLGRRDIAV
jgi:ABC-2 type transport system permease protein